MKVLVRFLSIVLFLVLGRVLFPYIFEITSELLESNRYEIVTTKVTEQFYALVFFVILFGMIPALMWISTRFVQYKSKGFEIFGFVFIGLVATLFAFFRGLWVRPIRTIIPDIPDQVLFSELKINQYLFFGICVGFLMYFGLGRLFKQMTLGKLGDKKRSKTEQEIGRIGEGEH